MKRGKRAQLYLISTIIIVILVTVLITVSNKISFKEEPKEFFDLTEVLEREGNWVHDYALYNSKDIDSVIQNFTDSFADYVKDNKEEDFDLIIIFGDKENAKLITYSSEEQGNIKVDIGGSPIIVNKYKQFGKGQTIFSPDNNGDVEFKVEDYTYKAHLGENENFLFYMTTSEDFEKYVSTNIEGYVNLNEEEDEGDDEK